jgi:hypothetical protein
VNCCLLTFSLVSPPPPSLYGVIEGEGAYTEKNANLRKILILLTNISKIIICFSELLFDASSNIDFFVTD